MKKYVVLLMCIAFTLSISVSAYAVWPFSKPTPTPAPLPEEQVNTLTGCYFFYDQASSKYFLLFSLLDKTNNPLSPVCNAEVTVKSNTGETLYQSKRSIGANDFKFWPLFIDRSLYCAGIQIDASLIKPCISGTGTISCHVYNDSYFDFDIFTLDAFNLPKTDPSTLCSLLIPGTPLELSYYTYNDKLRSTVKLNNIVFKFSPYFYTENVDLTVTIYGEKTYEDPDGTSFDQFNWKLFDSNSYLVDSGTAVLDNLSLGDKFKKDCIHLYNLPADHYRLELYDYK